MIRVLPTRSRRELSAFAALGVRDQVCCFMNWQSRLVHPHPRQVNKADGFDDLEAVQANRPSVEALLTGLGQGDDLNAHLSRDVAQGYCLPRDGRKGGPHFDLLLNEWGIHHLHLFQSSGRATFRGFGGQLLYVILGRGVAFVLNVAPHDVWTSKRLIETTIQSWPYQGLFVPLKGVLPGRNLPENEHLALCKAGVMTAPVINSQHWISGVTCGMSTALMSNRVMREAGRLLRIMVQAAAQPDHLHDQLKKNAEQNSMSWPEKPEVTIKWLEGPDRYCFKFVEQISGATLLIETAFG